VKLLTEPLAAAKAALFAGGSYHLPPIKEVKTPNCSAKHSCRRTRFARSGLNCYLFPAPADQAPREKEAGKAENKPEIAIRNGISNLSLSWPMR